MRRIEVATVNSLLFPGARQSATAETGRDVLHSCRVEDSDGEVAPGGHRSGRVAILATQLAFGAANRFNLTVSDLRTYLCCGRATQVLVHSCGEVAVDTNAVTDAPSGAKAAEVDADSVRWHATVEPGSKMSAGSMKIEC
jgi:hypothetical protein